MNKIRHYIKSTRLAEVSLMLGFPFMGIIFAFEDIASIFSLQVLIFTAGIFFLCISIYSFNAWAGTDEDVENERLLILKDRKKHFMLATVVSVLLFVTIFFLANPFFILLSLLSFCLWAVYSWPKKGFKYRPVLGTLIHFFGQMIHFQIGYAVLKTTDVESFLISAYFSLLFSAGHLNHELIDYEPDKKMGTNTGAVYFGQKKWETVSFIVFSFSTIYMIFLTFFEVADIVTCWPFIAAGIIHIVYRSLFVKNDLSKQRFLNERSFYRSLYFVSGLLFVLIKSILL